MKSEEEIDQILEIAFEKYEKNENASERTFLKGFITGICAITDRIEIVKE